MSKLTSLSYHINKFNDKVRVLNQSNGKQLILTQQEARDLQADIYSLLEIIAHHANNVSVEAPSSISVDGGKF